MTTAGFSTLGCPGVPIDNVLRLAQQYHADCVQLRIAQDEPVHTGLSARQRSGIRLKFSDAGVDFAALATYVKLSDPNLLGPLEQHLQLASDLGAPALRLFPGDVEAEIAVQRLSCAVSTAEGSGVKITLETHDSYLAGADIAGLLSASTAGAGAVWDVLHTWRSGEKLEDSAAALGPYLAELQIKDVPSKTDLRPVAPGNGEVPGREAIDVAIAGGFSGPIIFEHEAKWREDADAFEPSLAAAMALIRK